MATTHAPHAALHDAFSWLQVPKRAYSLEELRLNRIQPERFLAPRDNTLSGVRNLLQVWLLGWPGAAARGASVQSGLEVCVTERGASRNGCCCCRRCGQHHNSRETFGPRSCCCLHLLQGSYLAGLTAGYFSGALDFTQLAAVVVATAFLLTADQVRGSSVGAPSLTKLVDFLRWGYRRVIWKEG